MSNARKIKAFERWSALANEEMKESLLRAAEILTSLPLEHGFQLENKAFDSSDPPPYALNLERHVASGETNFIYVGFDKHHRARFQVLFGTKGTSPPHPWIRAGALVWKTGSELQEYKWWGAKWWQPNKVKAFNSEVEKAAALMPQIFDYLSSGTTGSHIFAELRQTGTEVVNSP